MSEHYHDENDFKLMRECASWRRRISTPGWAEQHRRPGEWRDPEEYRELIAIAVSATTQCPYCMEAHAKAAHAAGATREEVVEASLLAAALRAGGAATHGAMALKFFDKQAEQKKE